ncbi:substrate-binding periplasmic protein [Inhella gelatinilytica]|uniref:Transporter substrate-binding domain-containing protein n=1 Tax=Inhella gelatinilytica TaxID=2795030 RepID=A0A931IT58_9BURK|nr:transporter substrate-binding domain-containing protein [Inhella gelatinilytica]MBH9551664.1 transporter substrate-binding domain-containing protein [Inhella gelatinilytica]
MSVGLTALGWTGGAVGQAPVPLRLVADVDPPFVMPAGHALGPGIDIDIAQTALRLGGGPPISVEILPFRRTLLMLERGEADFTVGLRRTPEREQLLSFSRAYGTEVRHQFLVRGASGVRVRTLQELQGRQVGLVRGFAYPPALLAAVGSGATWGPNRPALLRMLEAGHVEVVAMTAVVATWLLQELSLTEALRIERFELPSGTGTHMAFARTPAAVSGLEALNRGLEALHKRGWERFHAPYLNRHPAR